MAVQDTDQYFTYDGRLASFRKTTKKRGSTSSGRGGSKALNWPHKQITPASLAKAGFYFNPSPDSPDNCVCFLCEKGLDGWESGDDPLHEHLTHSSECGWAILTAIEQDVQDYALQDPTLPHMVEARKATFAGRWPHDGKKGWQCKTKQLVDAGWMYTPTPESDDMATCTYCQLALDGWEPSDKPYDEHYKRSPNCGFFIIERQSQAAPKKTGRGKGARGSKASRVSTQSVQSAATTASGSSGAGDVTAEPEDSVLETASTMTKGKKAKARKPATTKAGKGGWGKAKNEESVVAEDTEDDNASVSEAAPAKTTRGRKRGSEAVEDSVVRSTARPTAKKRATKQTRGSVATESSAMSGDTTVPEAPNSAKTKKGRQSKTRKASSASNASATSLQEEQEPEQFPDDDEIERQLEADLERQLTEDEFAYEYRHKPPPRPSPQPERKASSHKSATYKMFDPAPSEAGDSEIDDELNGLKNEMDVDGVDEIHIPKKSRQAGIRKASKQTKTKTKKQKEPSPSPEPEPEPVEEPYETEDTPSDDNHSVASTDTVVRNEDSVYSSEQRGRARTRKASVASEDSVNMVTYVEPDDDTPTKRGRQPKKARQSRESTEEPDAQREAESGDDDDDEVDDDDRLMEPDDDLQIAEDPVESDAVESSPVRDDSHLSVEEPPSTPGHGISPAQSAKQAAVSPSPSLQSSDAENQPPSSKLNVITASKRTALAPLAATPSRMSPSKKNIMAGLQSTTPWTAANLEAIFAKPRGKSDKENGVEHFLKHGKDLTSPEKQMTVEEWIYYNAGEAEKQLKYECEKMVGVFEGEGTRAMKVLEGLSVE